MNKHTLNADVRFRWFQHWKKKMQ